MTLLREKADVQTQLEENEDDMAEVMKKYKAAVQKVTMVLCLLIPSPVQAQVLQ